MSTFHSNTGPKAKPSGRFSLGFTIVEMLVVIVVIGILAAVTIVAYNGVQQKALTASLISDLSSASTKLGIYQVDNSAYPTSVNSCPTPTVGNMCLTSSPGNVLTYTAVNTTSPQTYSLTATRSNGTAYVVTNNTTPQVTVAVVAPVSQTFNASGNFTVPAGVSSVKLEVWGGRGGNCLYDMGGGGGSGGYAKGTLAVAGGNVLNITVGSNGYDDPGNPCQGSNGGDTYINRPSASILLIGVGGVGAYDCDCDMDPSLGVTYSGLTNVSTGSAGPTHALITYTPGV